MPYYGKELRPYMDIFKQPDCPVKLVDIVRGKHPQAVVEAPNGKRAKISMSTSPSDRKGLLNFQQDLRRIRRRLTEETA